MAGAPKDSPSKTFRGLMERAWCEQYGWCVSFDGELFYRVDEMPRLGNVEEMVAQIADKSGCVGRRYFGYAGVEVVTVVSNRRGPGESVPG